jgi:hypothetical protein
MRVDAFLLQGENDFSAAFFQKNVNFSQPGVRIGDGRSSEIKNHSRPLDEDSRGRRCNEIAPRQLSRPGP